MRFLRPPARRLCSSASPPLTWERIASKDPKPGALPLLLVPGFACGIAEWTVLPRRLARTSRRDVIAFDHRGIGGSPAPAGPYSIPMLARDALAVMDSAGVDRAAVLGISMGGMVAQEMAITAPARVSGLVLGCTMHGGKEAHPPPSSFFETCSGLADGEPAATDAFLRAMLPPSALEGPAGERLLAQFHASFVQQRRDAEGLRGQLAAMMRFNSTKRLGSLGDCPTLVVTGSDDVVVPPANAASIAEKVPGAELLTWPDAGHFWWQHRTVEVCERIARFLLERCDR